MFFNLIVVNTNGDLPVNLLNGIFSIKLKSVLINPTFVSPDIRSNISIDEDLIGFATVAVTFLNASKPVSGSLLQGDTVDLNIEMLAGQSIGFFVVPDGWDRPGSGSTIVDDGLWDQPFYSLSALNPEPLSIQRHNVVFVDPLN
jgi:hypothetical protein